MMNSELHGKQSQSKNNNQSPFALSARKLRIFARPKFSLSTVYSTVGIVLTEELVSAICLLLEQSSVKIISHSILLLEH